jgi:ABC-type uncharacterized transport system involved in gliding motility auxiliary subunit
MVKRVLGLLGWLGTGLVLAAVLVRFFKPELQQVWNSLAMAGLVCVVLYLASQWREIGGSFSGRSARYGALSAVSVVIVLAILIGVNYIATRQNKRWDLTASGQFTLSDQTRRVLSGLKSPIQLQVFDRNEGFERFRDRLDAYTYVSPQVKVDYIDIDQNPAQARQEQVQTLGTVVVKYAGRTERITSDAEQDVTNAIIKVVEGKQKKVYFVLGHGEKDPTSSDERTGYNTIDTALGRDNFQVDKLILAQQGSVPEDASVLIIAGPTSDYLQPEVDMLRKYLDSGGKVLFMLDPPEGPNQPTPNLAALVKDWGIDIGNNVVVDVSGVGQLLGAGPSMPVAANYPAHPITERFSTLTAFPLARSVTVGNGANGRAAQSFVETGAQSWAETDLKALGSGAKVALDEQAGDKRGPISIAAAVSADAPQQPAATPEPAGQKPDTGAQDKPKVQSRVAVIGDSDFASNGFLGVAGNRDLFLNTVNWLAQQENMISIRPREAEDRRVTLTAERQRLTFYVSVLGIPLLVIAAGVATWWKRR